MVEVDHAYLTANGFKIMEFLREKNGDEAYKKRAQFLRTTANDSGDPCLNQSGNIAMIAS